MENEETLKTVSIGPENTKITRTYEVTDSGCVLVIKKNVFFLELILVLQTLRHESTGTEGKRYFKKL